MKELEKVFGEGKKEFQLEEGLGINPSMMSGFFQTIGARSRQLQKFAEELEGSIGNDKVVATVTNVVQKGAELLKERTDGRQGFSDFEIRLVKMANILFDDLVEQKLRGLAEPSGSFVTRFTIKRMLSDEYQSSEFAFALASAFAQRR